MLKNFIPVSLIIVSAFAILGCESRDVRACKKLAHQQIEDVCNAAEQEFRKIEENQELDDMYKGAAEEAIMSRYAFCFDGEDLKQAIEKVDLACESDPSVVTRK